MKKLLAIVIMLSLAAISFMACDETATDPGTLSTVTFNLAASPYENMVGRPVAVSLWSNWGDNTAFKITQGTFSGTSTTLSISGVAPGTYIAVATVDLAGDGFPTDGPAGEGDIFWAGLDVTVSANMTIAVSQYAWQYIDAYSQLFGVRGIPAGNDGEIFAMGIFPDSVDIYSQNPNPYMGGVGLVYNNAAVIAVNPDNNGDSSYVPADLPTGNYDVWMLIDLDGVISSWHDTVGSDQPITNGDLIASYDYAYTSGSYDAPVITASFAAVQTLTLTFNVTVPAGVNLDGNDVMAMLWSDFQSDNPYTATLGTIAAGSASLVVEMPVEGSFIAAVFLDGDGSGFSYVDGPMDSNDYFWGALNVAPTTNTIIEVAADYWQHFNKYVVAVDGIPSGHDGEVFAAGLFPDGGNPLDPYNQNIMGGSGIIYNNSAILSLNSDYQDTSWYLPTDNYDIWCLLDVDGSLSDYDRAPGDSSAMYVITSGDYWYKYNYTHAPAFPENDDVIEFSGTFTPTVGITGAVSCSTWNISGGDIYLYLFKDNPLFNDTSDAISSISLTGPGTYWLPCLPGDTVLAIGFWDVDNSGEWDGPTQDDIIGGYGSAIDSLNLFICSELGVGGIDFELAVPYDTATYGP